MVIQMEKNGAERTCTMSKIFIDTNILVYCLDNNYPEKQKKCRSLLKSIRDESYGVISTQVIQEFYVCSVKKLNSDPIIIKNIINTYEHFEIVTINLGLIKDAIDLSVLNRISFWDSLILTAAGSSKCKILWTEDLNHGQIINGVEIINPLKI